MYSIHRSYSTQNFTIIHRHHSSSQSLGVIFIVTSFVFTKNTKETELKLLWLLVSQLLCYSFSFFSCLHRLTHSTKILFTSSSEIPSSPFVWRRNTTRSRIEERMAFCLFFFFNFSLSHYLYCLICMETKFFNYLRSIFLLM